MSCLFSFLFHIYVHVHHAFKYRKRKMRKKKTARYTKIAIVIARRCHCHHPHHRYNGYTDDLDAHVTREQYQNASACARARRISSTQWHSNIGILCACFVCSAYIVFTLEFVDCSEWRKISHSGKWWLIDLHLPHATLSLARSVTPLMCFHANCHFFYPVYVILHSHAAKAWFENCDQAIWTSSAQPRHSF